MQFISLDSSDLSHKLGPPNDISDDNKCMNQRPIAFRNFAPMAEDSRDTQMQAALNAKYQHAFGPKLNFKVGESNTDTRAQPKSQIIRSGGDEVKIKGVNSFQQTWTEESSANHKIIACCPLTKLSNTIKLEPSQGDIAYSPVMSQGNGKNRNLIPDKNSLDKTLAFKVDQISSPIRLSTYEKFIVASSMDEPSKSKSRKSRFSPQKDLALHMKLRRVKDDDIDSKDGYQIDTILDVEELLSKHSGFNMYYEEKVAKFNARKKVDRKTRVFNTVLGMPYAQRLSLRQLMSLESEGN